MISAFPLGLGLLVAFSVFPSAAWAETYRWVDDAGEVHYSDQVPPDQAKHRRAKLNPQGREVEVVEGAKSLEQLRREKQVAQLRAEQNRILNDQRRRDLSLLDSYGSEEEMQLALKGKLASLDSVISVLRSNRQRQVENLAVQEKRAADLERTGEEVPKNLRDTIDSVRRQIAVSDEKIRSLEGDKVALSNEYASDLARFRVIKSEQRMLVDQIGLSPPDLAGSPGDNGTLGSVYVCSAEATCERAWQLARDYVLKHASTPLTTETRQVLQTAAPLTDQQIRLTVTRTVNPRSSTLFLDVRCRPSFAGEELCRGQKVYEITSHFRPFVEGGLAADAGIVAPTSSQQP